MPRARRRPALNRPPAAADAPSATQFQRRWWSAEAAPGKKESKKKKDKQAQQAEDDAPTTSTGLSTIGLMPYRRPRLQQYYDSIVARELVLKTNVSSYQQLPRIQRLDLSFTAPASFKQAYVEKWQMLFYALGLEYLTGARASAAGGGGGGGSPSTPACLLPARWIARARACGPSRAGRLPPRVQARWRRTTRCSRSTCWATRRRACA